MLKGVLSGEEHHINEFLNGEVAIAITSHEILIGLLDFCIENNVRWDHGDYIEISDKVRNYIYDAFSPAQTCFYTVEIFNGSHIGLVNATIKSVEIYDRYRIINL